MFYKTNSIEVMNAKKDTLNKQKNFCIAAEEFAKEFDAEAVVLRSGLTVYFDGLKFNNKSAINFDVWRKPSSPRWTCRLRSKPTKKIHQAAWDAESAKYEMLSKKYFKDGERISIEGFYKSVGLSEGSLIFESFESFVFNETIYIKTSCTLKGITEILGSEYQEAKTKSHLTEREEAV